MINIQIALMALGALIGIIAFMGWELHKVRKENIQYLKELDVLTNECNELYNDLLETEALLNERPIRYRSLERPFDQFAGESDGVKSDEVRKQSDNRRAGFGLPRDNY